MGGAGGVLLPVAFPDHADAAGTGEPQPVRPGPGDQRQQRVGADRAQVRRRRAVRRITNVLLIATLSLISAYFITRPTGGTGFRARNLPANPAPTPTPGIHPPASPPPSAPVPASSEANGYELEPGPYTVSEAEDLILHDALHGKELHVRIFYPNPARKYPVISLFARGRRLAELL